MAIRRAEQAFDAGNHELAAKFAALAHRGYLNRTHKDPATTTSQ